MKARPSAVLIELDPPRPRRRGRALAAGAALGAMLIAAAALAAVPSRPQTVPAAAPLAASAAPSAAPPPRTLALPADVTDVELVAFPDWLANEPPPARMRATVAVRGTLGLASVEGPATINWTEDGISYHLTSMRRGVSELVGVAARLRLARR